MTRIVVNETLRGLLPDLSRPVMFCDEKGQILGRFLPETPVFIGREPPPLSKEELDRRLAEPTYTTAEVLAYLESLE
jgi:hypothetical protein